MGLNQPTGATSSMKHGKKTCFQCLACQRFRLAKEVEQGNPFPAWTSQDCFYSPWRRPWHIMITVIPSNTPLLSMMCSIIQLISMYPYRIAESTHMEWSSKNNPPILTRASSPDAGAPSGAFRWTAATPGLSPEKSACKPLKSHLEMETGDSNCRFWMVFDG